MDQQQLKYSSPYHTIFQCNLCKEIFQRPITLACGHSFCHSCLLKSTLKKKLTQQKEDQVLSIPLCPWCQSIIWKPLSSLKENVVLSSLINKFYPQRNKLENNIVFDQSSQIQYHILLQNAQFNTIPLPCCYTKIIFATAFLHEILEQQSQTNLLILQWEGAHQRIAIAGRIYRPEIYHYSMKASRYQTVYNADFQGKFFVKIQQKQQIDLNVNNQDHNGKQQKTTSRIVLCRVNEVKAKNIVSLQKLNPFFNIYDQLNNPAFLRQINQLVDQKVLHQRNNPQQIIYCIMRLLRISQQLVKQLAESMDDQLRWMSLQQFILKNNDKAAVDIVKVNIPGRYSHEFVFSVLFALIILHYIFQ